MERVRKAGGSAYTFFLKLLFPLKATKTGMTFLLREGLKAANLCKPLRRFQDVSSVEHFLPIHFNLTEALSVSGTGKLTETWKGFIL